MGIELVTAWVIVVALGVYAVLGGADFGSGALEMLARGPRKRAQRGALSDAIGPIWEANHIWLIVVIVVTFICFPRAFAMASTALHVPLTIMLLGIVLRGSAYVFRMYGAPEQSRAWGLAFSVASVATPVMLGVCLGALGTGRLTFDDAGVYTGGWIVAWMAPFPWLVGLFALTLFAQLAAVYMCVETDGALRGDFRRRALLLSGGVVVVGLVVRVVAIGGAPTLSDRLLGSWWSWPLQGLTAVATGVLFWSLWTGRVALARSAAVAQAGLVVAGFGASMFPDLIVGAVTIEEASAPWLTHALTLGSLAAGSVVLLPSLWLLMRTFKGERAFAVVDAGGAG